MGVGVLVALEVGFGEGVRKDDFPLRIIIAFEYLPERAGLWERARARLSVKSMSSR